MIVEHITIGGDSAHIDTEHITPEMLDHFNNFRIYQDKNNLKIEGTSLTVNLYMIEKGVIFDICKHGDVAIKNLCAFESDCSHLLYRAAIDLARKLKVEVRPPLRSQWMYSGVVNVQLLNAAELIICREIELYIYYAIWLAWKKIKA